METRETQLNDGLMPRMGIKNDSANDPLYTQSGQLSGASA